MNNNVLLQCFLYLYFSVTILLVQSTINDAPLHCYIQSQCEIKATVEINSDNGADNITCIEDIIPCESLLYALNNIASRFDTNWLLLVTSDLDITSQINVTLTDNISDTCIAICGDELYTISAYYQYSPVILSVSSGLYLSRMSIVNLAFDFRITEITATPESVIIKKFASVILSNIIVTQSSDWNIQECENIVLQSVSFHLIFYYVAILYLKGTSNFNLRNVTINYTRGFHNMLLAL